MKLKRVVEYIWKDLISRRSVLGTIGLIVVIILASAFLIFSISLTKNINNFIDKCFLFSRPEIGVILIKPKSNELVSLKDKELLDKLVKENENIEAISWCTNFINFDFHINKKYLFSYPCNSNIIKKLKEKRLDKDFLERLKKEINWNKNRKFKYELIKKDKKWIIKLKNGFRYKIKYNKKDDILQVYSFNYIELIWDPIVYSLPYNTVLFNSNYGVKFILGKNFEYKPQLTFGIILNTKYLKKYLNFTEKDIKNILNNRYSSIIPKSIPFYFPPLILKNNKKIEVGYVEIPVVGVVHLPNKIYPHFFVTYDVACAYYYENRQRWEPSYIFQFYNPKTDKLFISKEKYNRVLKEKDSLETFIKLPKKDKLLKFINKDKTIYTMAYIWVKKYKEKGIRSKIIQYIEKKSPQKWDFYVPSDLVSQGLNSINKIINEYSFWIKLIIILLCGGSIGFWGINHIFKKRKDIGILESCGISKKTLIKIFSGEVFIIVIIGFLLGLFIYIIIFYLFIEGYIQTIIKDLIKNFSFYEYLNNIEILNINIILEAIIYIGIGYIIGITFIILRFLKLNPIKELNSSL